MNANEQDAKINSFLIDMGIAPSPQFTYTPDAQDVRYVIVQYLGLNVIILLANHHCAMIINLGYLPERDNAVLFWRLLTLNSTLLTAACVIQEPNDQLQLKASRPLEGLKAVEFRQMLDTLCLICRNHGLSLIQEFKLAQQPPGRR